MKRRATVVRGTDGEGGEVEGKRSPRVSKLRVA